MLRKAYNRRAGLAAAALSVATTGILPGLLDLALVRETIPAMIVLGPLTVAQYLARRRRAQERTTWEYLEADPLDRVAVRPPSSDRSD